MSSSFHFFSMYIFYEQYALSISSKKIGIEKITFIF